MKTEPRSDYDLTFVSRAPRWRNRLWRKCRLLRMVGHRKCEIEFADGTGPVRVHVLAVRPSPLDATKAHLRSLGGTDDD